MRIASRDRVACLLLLLICVQFVLVLRVLSLAFKDCAQVTLPRPGLCSTAYLCASTDVLLGLPRLVHTNTHYPRIPMLTHAIVLRGSSVVDHRSSTTHFDIQYRVLHSHFLARSPPFFPLLQADGCLTRTYWFNPFLLCISS